MNTDTREGRNEFVNAFESVDRVFLDRFEDQVVEFVGDIFVVHRQGSGAFLEVLVQEFGLRVASKRRPAAGQLVAGDSKAIDIGREFGRLSSNLSGIR